MVMLKNPDNPATSKQLWLLHILTKTDTRNLNLTMAQASAKIEALKAGKSATETRPLVNPHASAIKRDSQKIAQAKFDKTMPERQIVQGKRPTGKTDMTKIQADFMAKAYPIGRQKAGNDTATIDFYDFNCQDCLFGQSGICEPSWEDAGLMTCSGKIESVSFKCKNYEPTEHRLNAYCHRPKGKQCHRKHVDNACLECAYRKQGWIHNYQNHSAWYDYIPPIAERIAQHTKDLETWINPPETYKDIDFTESIQTKQNIIRMLNKLEG